MASSSRKNTCVRCLNRRNIRIDKHTHANAFRLEARDERLDGIHFGARCETSVGCAHVYGVGDERGLVRQGGLYNRHKIVVWIAFDIEFAPRVFHHERSKRRDVAPANVSLVGARVNGDAVGARVENGFGGVQQVGQAVVAAVS